ncbi:MAG: glycosyltransferase [Leptospiraceae bacterium]|nr:glycosyltransferase [Leptospiraceae bacterium]
MSVTSGLSVIIPHRKEESLEEAVSHLRKMDASGVAVELFTVSGNHPSVQRNACIRESRGDIIYFLDNDSEPEPQNLKRALELFRDPAVAVVGGPNLPREGQHGIQKDFSAILASPLAVGPVADRYRSSGPVREATDRELILCNLFIRKSVLDELGYFREDLYPNEENEFMNRIQSAGYKLMYDPEIRVHRSPRPDLKSFLRMLMGYGRGRFKQMTVDFRIQNCVFFLPALFAGFIAALPVVLAGFLAAGEWTELGRVTLQEASHILRWPWSAALLLYAAALPPYLGLVLFAGSLTFGRIQKPRSALSILRLPFLFFCVHFFYGLGLWRGLFSLLRSEKKVVEYELNRMQIC